MQENYEIIAKYFAGEDLSEEEKVMVENARDDLVFWSEMEALFLNTGKALQYRFFNADKAWEKARNETATKRDDSHSIVGWLKYAASVALLVTCSLLLWHLFFSDKYLTYSTEGFDYDRPEYVLEDGTIITLNYGSALKIPRNFSCHNRIVYFEGEAFFEVATDPVHPFVVKLGDANVKVLGTSFNVRSYPGTPVVEVAVNNGRVEVGSPIKNNMQQKIVLEKNQKGIVMHETGEVIKQNYFNKNELAWITRHLEFESASLGEVINTVERSYNSNISFNASVDTTQLITASFDRQNISYVLDVIAMTLNLNVMQEENKFYIENK